MDIVVEYLLYIFITLTGIFSIIIFITEYPPRLQLDRLGIENLFDLYAIPIRVGVATFALFATYLTLKRMAQTDHQIKEAEVNNLFNNYYNHLEAFIKLFEQHKLFQIGNHKIDTRSVLTSLYKYYFSPSFYDFSHLIVKETRFKILEFQRNVELSSINCSPIKVWDIDISELTELIKYIDVELARVVKFLVLKYTDEISERTRIDSTGPNLDNDTFIIVNTICLASMFYSSLLVFEGVNNSINPSIDFFYDEYMNGVLALIPQRLL